MVAGWHGRAQQAMSWVFLWEMGALVVGAVSSLNSICLACIKKDDMIFLRPVAFFLQVAETFGAGVLEINAEVLVRSLCCLLSGDASV